MIFYLKDSVHHSVRRFWSSSLGDHPHHSQPNIIPSQIFFKLQEGLSHHRLDHCSLRQCLALAVQKTPGDSAPPTERREKLFWGFWGENINMHQQLLEGWTIIFKKLVLKLPDTHFHTFHGLSNVLLHLPPRMGPFCPRWLGDRRPFVAGRLGWSSRGAAPSRCVSPHTWRLYEGFRGPEKLI